MSLSVFPAERHVYEDPRSGRRVTRWTDHKCHSHHLYFTNPGWFDGGRRLLFGSDRGNRTNLYSVDRESGEITRHTDGDMPGPPRETTFQYASLNPRRPEAYFWRGSDLIAVDLARGGERLLYRAEDRFIVNMTNATADGAAVCAVVYEDLSDRFPVDLLQGYVGFREYWEARPESRILRVPVDGGPAEVVWEERYWVGHVNTSPTQPHLLTFCHEGPWDAVDNRIWVLDLRSGRATPLRERKSPGEKVGHEYWHADGVHVGYHGEGAGGGDKLFGRVRWDGADPFEVSFPHHTGHVHSNGFELLVGDGFTASPRVLRLWRWDAARGGFDGPRVLCEHNGSLHVQKTHVHPRFAPDGRTVVFTTDRTGYGQVYEVEVGDFESLPPLA